MTRTVTNVIKITGIRAVEFQGKLKYEEGWQIDNDRLDDWFEKLEGKHVILKIDAFEADDSAMLKE